MSDQAQRTSNEQVRPLADRLLDACVAGCTCLTKTPDIQHHEPLCHYRLFMESWYALRTAHEPTPQASKELVGALSLLRNAEGEPWVTLRESDAKNLIDEFERLQRELAEQKKRGDYSAGMYQKEGADHLRERQATRVADEPPAIRIIEKEYQERANAWHAVFEKMLRHNPSFCANELTGKESALAELDRLYGAAEPPSEIPHELFDGYSVLQELTQQQRLRTSPENVSDVLDAAVRLMRRMRQPSTKNGSDT